MARRPLPFLVVPPAVMIALVALGWGGSGPKVESDIANLWMATSGPYRADKTYAAEARAVSSSGPGGPGGTSVFAAMAASRDGGNVLRGDRLDEMSDRMREVENITIEHGDRTFTWSDLCSSNNAGGPDTTYRFPCGRYTALDYYREARWHFDEASRLTWYDLIRSLLVAPLVPKYGVLRDYCTSGGRSSISGACDRRLRLRTDAEFAESEGHGWEYASALGLFGDLAEMEAGDPCRVCVGGAHGELIANWTGGAVALFEGLSSHLGDVASSTSPHSDWASELLADVEAAARTVSVPSVEEFHLYYVVRDLYADLGAETYMGRYNELREEFAPVIEWMCPECADSVPMNVTLEGAREALYRHADSDQSGVNTGGNPLPLWNPVTGYLLDSRYIDAEELGPVGGSGLDMSGGPTTGGLPLQGAAYFDEERDPNLFDGDGPEFALVLHDPVFVWFMSSVRPLESRCGNDPLPADREGRASVLLKPYSVEWCTEYDAPRTEYETRTKRHFAKMWYDLLIDSTNFLDLRRGESDPYVWTTGLGCGYEAGGTRPSYSNATEEEVLLGASMELYYADEGLAVGAVERGVVIGGAVPPIGEYDRSRPLESVRLVQNVYESLLPEGIVERVKNCNRPGGPIYDLTVDDATDVLRRFKEEFEVTWSRGWDDPNDGDVQMVAFVDDTGATGSVGRMLREVTLSGGTLMAVSFAIIVVFSAMFLASTDAVRSRVLITTVGVALVVLSFFAALGLAILLGIKINITIGWTLPFIIVGLGVDDMYIISLALKERGGYRLEDFTEAMRDVSIPVTMTSLVNFAMFAVMNVSDIPAVYKTAQAAMLSVAFLWAAVLFCFPAYCYLDMKRQAAGRADVLFCLKPGGGNKDDRPPPTASTAGMIYDRVYRPLIISRGFPRTVTHAFVWVAAAALLCVGVYGATRARVGLGLEDFFSTERQVGVWAAHRTAHLASWNVRMNWGRLDYGDPQTQLRMIRQFEGVVASRFVSEMNTENIWIAAFALWTTRQCRDEECGRDFDCVGTWEKNALGLRLKSDGRGECNDQGTGVCRLTTNMHPDDLADLAEEGRYNPDDEDSDATWCPVFDADAEKLEFCITKWGGGGGLQFGGGGGLLFEPGTTGGNTNYDCPSQLDPNSTEMPRLISPIPLSNTPLMFAINLYTHDETIAMIKETRAICDDDEVTHCWMSGVPYDYWEQYTYADRLLLQIVGVSAAVGFGVSAVFLISKIGLDHQHTFRKVVAGSLGGAFLITATCILSVVTVVGLSSLAGVNLTAFSVMSFVLSIGFVVEYSVHITLRFITAPMEYKSAKERVEYSMSFLFLPTFMAFISSTIGVVCLAFTEFQFNRVYFFRPLIIVMFVTYFFGSFFLPVLLSVIDLDLLKMGHYRGQGNREKSDDFNAEMESVEVAPELASYESQVSPDS